MERLTFQNFIKQWWLRQQVESDEVVRLRVADQRMENGYEVDTQIKRDVSSLRDKDAQYEAYAQGLRNIPLFIIKAIWILLVVVGVLYGLFSLDSVNPIALSIIIGAIIIAIAIKSKG